MSQSPIRTPTSRKIGSAPRALRVLQNILDAKDAGLWLTKSREMRARAALAEKIRAWKDGRTKEDFTRLGLRVLEEKEIVDEDSGERLKLFRVAAFVRENPRENEELMKYLGIWTGGKKVGMSKSLNAYGGYMRKFGEVETYAKGPIPIAFPRENMAREFRLQFYSYRRAFKAFADGQKDVNMHLMVETLDRVKLTMREEGGKWHVTVGLREQLQDGMDICVLAGLEQMLGGGGEDTPPFIAPDGHVNERRGASREEDECEEVRAPAGSELLIEKLFGG